MQECRRIIDCGAYGDHDDGGDGEQGEREEQRVYLAGSSRVVFNDFSRSEAEPSDDGAYGEQQYP